ITYSVEHLKQHCGKDETEKLSTSDFHWNYGLLEMVSRFLEIYESPKRLDRRAYFDTSTRRFILPFESERGGDVVLPASFADNVRRHIEEAIGSNYIDGVFYPDMGHSHFLVPEIAWEDIYSKYPIERTSDLYRDLMKDPELKVLYHTGEQLKFKENGEFL